ncbi:MAG: hypothetical protein AAGH78_02930, partial [Cyanobacteria bacterium P01_H01_bin.58]
MKKLSFTSIQDLGTFRKLPQRCTVPLTACWYRMSGASLLIASALAGMPTLALADEASEVPVTVAQSVATGLPPLPYDSSAALPSEQYVVLVNGNSDLLLQQVRQVEPGAFVNFIDG